MSNADLNWIASYIWGIADDVRHGLFLQCGHVDATFLR